MLHLKWCAEARHASNMRDVPFSMMVDSLANLGRRLPRKRWKEDRSLVSYMSAHNYLYMLALLRPPPPFQVCVYASAYMWDQFYQKEHGNCKNGYSGTAGVKGDLSGHVWRNQTNLNWIEVILPVTAFMPTESELAEIIVCGPYTQPMGSVYPMLQPAKVCAPPAPPSLAVAHHLALPGRRRAGEERPVAVVRRGPAACLAGPIWMAMHSSVQRSRQP